MAQAKLNHPVTDIPLNATADQVIKLSDFLGKKVVLYFYPRDNTPGCTLEGQNFSNAKRKFSARNTVILGISRDPIKAHERFKEKYRFNFDLLSDADEKLCRQFDVIKEKNMYGKKVLGIERSTFLIDERGVLIAAWRKVKIEGHVEAVLDAIKQCKHNK